MSRNFAWRPPPALTLPSASRRGDHRFGLTETSIRVIFRLSTGHEVGQQAKLSEQNYSVIGENERPDSVTAKNIPPQVWDLLSSDERKIAELMLHTDQPLGSARAHKHLQSLGVKVSQATVSRMLLRLDEFGVTEAIGKSGRRLTGQARSALMRASLHRRRNQLIDSLFEQADRSELLDLLALRKTIEVEAAELACERADEKDHRELLDNLVAYGQHSRQGGDFSKDALEFHVLLCRAPHSTPYALIAEALYPEMSRLEPLLVAAAHRAGEHNRSHQEHTTIAHAIIRRDVNASRRATSEHFDTMIQWMASLSNSDFNWFIKEIR